MKTNKLFFLFFFILIFSSANVYSISITPAVQEVSYNPGDIGSAKFFIGESSGKINVTAGGSLAVPGSVKVSPALFDLKSGQSQQIIITYQIAEISTPGRHDLSVTAREVPPELTYGQKTGGIRAVVAIGGRIQTFIKYPNKYAEIDFTYDRRVKKGVKIFFGAELKNLGSKTIGSASGEVLLYDLNQQLVKKATLTPISSLGPGETANLVGEMATTDLKVGKYTLQALVDYDGNKLESNKYILLLGEINLDILDIAKKSLPLNQISELGINVKSSWNEKIDYFLDVSLLDQKGQKLTTVKSPAFNINPWQSATPQVYLDTKGLSVGEYDLEVVANYNTKTSQNKFKINLIDALAPLAGKAVQLQPVTTSNKSDFTMWIIIILIVLIVVIIGLLVVVLLMFNKKRELEK